MPPKKRNKLFVRDSLSIPPEYPIGRLRGRLPKLSCVTDFRKKLSRTEKRKSLVACNAGEKYVTNGRPLIINMGGLKLHSP